MGSDLLMAAGSRISRSLGRPLRSATKKRPGMLPRAERRIGFCRFIGAFTGGQAQSIEVGKLHILRNEQRYLDLAAFG